MAKSGMESFALGTPLLRQQFGLDKDILTLNHGSWGSLPACVFAARQEILARIESNPDRFFRIEQFSELDKALERVAPVLGLKDIDDLVFVTNASTGVTAALGALKKTIELRTPNQPQSRVPKILMLSTTYIGTSLAVRFAAKRDGFEILEIPTVFPMSDQTLLNLVSTAILQEEERGGRVVMAVYDVIMSMPGLLLPYQQLTRLFKSHNILTFVDGAQAIGQTPLDLPSFDPDYFVTNCHKWLYTPRSCALLYVKKDVQSTISHPVVADSFDSADWKSTFIRPGAALDLSNYLSLLTALSFFDSLGGIPAVIQYNHTLATKGGHRVAEILGTSVMSSVTPNTAPDSNYASMVNVAVPETETVLEGGDAFMSGLMVRLIEREKANLTLFKHGGRWWIRLSAQVYLSEADFERVGWLLKRVFDGK
ncbi:hypothetical protein HDU98_000143 [Podochytrium sp. JEL0797]|nr:hypothetical protein HDU98_000143 [Podochytrium sp. JEL0797]